MKKTGSLNLSESYKEDFDCTIFTVFKELSNPEKECQSNLKEPVWKCRYGVTIIGFLVLLMSSIHRTIMSVVIVAMVNNTAINRNSKAKSESCLDLISNTTQGGISRGIRTEGELIWSPEIQGYILGSYFVGHVLTAIPSGRLAERYGCKWIIVVSTLVPGILTMLIPPFSQLSAFAVIVIQALRGLFQGLNGPCVNILASNWSPKNERGFLYSIMMSAISLGPALGNIFAGYISESPGGWSYALYSVGGIGLALAVYVSFFIAESPKEHPRISKAELNYILNNQEGRLARKRPQLPWRQIFTSVPAYALFYAMFGRFWSFAQFWNVHSTFLGTILHYPIGQNGLLSAIPFLLAFILSQIASWISLYIEKKEVVSVDFLRKFWTFTSCLGYSSCLMGIYIAGCDRNLSVIFATLSMGFIGMGTPGAPLVTQDLSPTFSGTLFGISLTAGFLTNVILPLVVGYLTDNMQTLERWNIVFFISIGVVMSSAVVFVIFGSAKIQPWNFVEEESKKSDEKQPERDKNNEMTRI